MTPSDMTLRDLMTQYVAAAADCSLGYKRNFLHCYRRFERFMGEEVVRDCTAVTTLHFAKFRQDATEAGLRPPTIELTIQLIRIALKWGKTVGLHGSDIPAAGRRLRNRPTLDVPSFHALQDFLRHLEVATYPDPAPKPGNGGFGCRWWGQSPLLFWQVWYALSYFGALSTADLENLRWDMIQERQDGRWIVTQRQKSGKLIQIWIHPVLAHYLDQVDRSRGPHVLGVPRHMRHRCRQEVHRIAKAAGTVPMSNKRMRRIAANQYEEAHAGAGAVILTHAVTHLGTSATPFYIDPARIVRRAAERLLVPEPLMPEGMESDRDIYAEQQLLERFRRLPVRDRRVLMEISNSLSD